MKRTITALVAGVVLGTTGLGVASSQGESWVRNGVICTSTAGGDKAVDRGVVCGLLSNKSNRLAIVNQKQIIVGARGKVLYFTSSR